MTKYYIVLDIGKTHVKFFLTDENYNIIINTHCRNRVISTGLYPHVDIEGIWTWFLVQLRSIASDYTITAINVCTHGCAAALINHQDIKHDSGLVLPVMDYEWTGIESASRYKEFRPCFNETYTHFSLKGRILGWQLFWLSQYHPELFAKVSAILLYPQYWVWRMTGKLMSEITSLGCHSDLWHVRESRFSSLVERMGWEEKFPPMHHAVDKVGNISSAFAEQSHLNRDCLVYPGIHDSNASYYCYMNNKGDVNKTIITTGTWIVCLTPDPPPVSIFEQQNMKVLVDIYGRPVTCTSYMGGREFEMLVKHFEEVPSTELCEVDIQQILDSKSMVLPNCHDDSDPTLARQGLKIVGTPASGIALATVYIAMRIHYDLSLLDGHRDVVIEGVFSKCRFLCGMLAQLNPDMTISVSSDSAGSVTGTASICIRDINKNRAILSYDKCEPTSFSVLKTYYQTWKALMMRTGVHVSY